MSNKETIINEINDLFRSPSALLYGGDAYKVVSWGSCKSYLSWPEGAPEGWDELEEGVEYFIGRSGDFRKVFLAADTEYTRLYAVSESSIEDLAENICYELDLEDNEWDEVA